MTVVQLCTRAFHKSSKMLFIQDSSRVLKVKSKQKYCDTKVKVLDNIPKTSRWYRLSWRVTKSLEWEWNEVLEPRLDSSAAQSTCDILARLSASNAENIDSLRNLALTQNNNYSKPFNV